MAIRIIQNVPAAKVDALVRRLKEAGATDVSAIDEGDDEFTLVITYPDRERLADLELRQRSDATESSV
jgi:hypothetical protein